MKVCFFETLARAVRHSGVEIPDVPAIGDRHVAGVRPAIDEDDAVLAKQAIVGSHNRQSARRRIPAPAGRRDSARSRRDRRVFARPTPACDPRGRTMTGNARSAAMSRQRDRRCATLATSCSRVTAIVAGISRPSIPSSTRCSLSRSRLPISCGGLSSGRGQLRRGAIDLASASRHSSEFGRDHDRDVVIGQRHRQFDFRHRHRASSVRCRTRSSRNSIGVLLPMSIAAASARTRSRGCRRPRMANGTIDGRPASRAGSPARLLVAEQLRDQRQIEPLACLDGAVEQPWRSGFARADEDRFRRRPFSSSLAIRCDQRKRPGEVRSLASGGCHLTPHRWQAPGAANCEETSP